MPQNHRRDASRQAEMGVLNGGGSSEADVMVQKKADWPMMGGATTQHTSSCAPMRIPMGSESGRTDSGGGRGMRPSSAPPIPSQGMQCSCASALTGAGEPTGCGRRWGRPRLSTAQPGTCLHDQAEWVDGWAGAVSAASGRLGQLRGRAWRRSRRSTGRTAKLTRH